MRLFAWQEVVGSIWRDISSTGRAASTNVEKTLSDDEDFLARTFSLLSPKRTWRSMKISIIIGICFCTTVLQAADGICERSPAMVVALEKTFRNKCEFITKDDLLRISTLEIEGDEFEPGDFEYLNPREFDFRVSNLSIQLESELKGFTQLIRLAITTNHFFGQRLPNLPALQYLKIASQEWISMRPSLLKFTMSITSRLSLQTI